MPPTGLEPVSFILKNNEYYSLKMRPHASEIIILSYPNLTK